MRIGPYPLPNNLILAPMAGVTDRPFRELCTQMGAGLTVSEMVASNPHLQQHKRTLQKTDHSGVSGIRSVQILGTEPQQMADAARLNVARGAQIIDINMGCPAKKVCSVAAGSALMKDEDKVVRILDAVVSAVDVPVTLKIRTGWDKNNRNAVRIANIAQNSGIQALTIHGRTRACKFNGHAEYDTIKAVKESIRIPVIANGDITTAEKAQQVLEHTGADGIMIGRAAQGKPWVFREILQKMDATCSLTRLTKNEILQLINQHLDALYSFYGNTKGVHMARKHIGWYFGHLPHTSKHDIQLIFKAEHPQNQLALVNALF